MAYNNGAFTVENFTTNQIPEGLFSMASLRAMGSELTTLAVVVTLYVLARKYNDKLDRDEELKR